MAIEGPTGTQRFVNHYFDEYPPQFVFQSQTSLLEPDAANISSSNSPAFRKSRKVLMQTLLDGHPKHSMAEGLFAENIVRISLQSTLEDTGFSAILAPQTLERSSKHHQGVDLVIADPTNTLWLGIDAKLRVGSSPYERDGYGWNPEILTPYIYLSLGNWNGALREMTVPVKEWLSTHVIDGITKSQPIPGFNRFNRYLVERIERSLAGCRERTVEQSGTCIYGVPTSEYEREIFEEKLHLMQGLFAEIKMNM